MGKNPKVAIIVLNYNGSGQLLPCLESLSGLTYPEKEVIVVDNASQDGSWEEAKLRFPEHVFIRNGKNLGFAGGMNVGIRATLPRGAEWVWLFNNDATAEQDSLSLLMETAKRFPDTGLLSPLILDPETENIWFARGRVNWWRMRTEHEAVSQPLLKEPFYPSEILTGCALLIRKEVIGRIGLLDERFFLYYEDADYSLRASKSGFENVVVPGARVFHGEQSRLNPDKVYHLVLSGLRFFAMHTPWYRRPYMAIYATIRRLKNRLDIGFRRDGAALKVRQAYADYLHGNLT